MKILVRLVGVAAAAATLASCGGGGGGGGGDAAGGGYGGGGGMTDPGTCSATFCMAASSFFPTTATVARGTAVTWLNSSGLTHNVTFDNQAAADAAVTGGSANIPNHLAGTNSRVFNTAGTYAFHCTIHGTTMSGTLTVP